MAVEFNPYIGKVIEHTVAQQPSLEQHPTHEFFSGEFKEFVFTFAEWADLIDEGELEQVNFEPSNPVHRDYNVHGPQRHTPNEHVISNAAKSRIRYYMVEDSDQRQDLATARAYVNRAATLLTSGRIEDAVPVLQQVLRMQEKLCASAVDQAVVCESIAAVLKKLGRPQECSQWIARAQALRNPCEEETREKERLQQAAREDPFSLETEVALLSYAIYLLAKNRSLEAVPLLEQMLRIQQKRSDLPSEQAETCEWIADALRRAGCNDESSQWKTYAYQIRFPVESSESSVQITPVPRKGERTPPRILNPVFVRSVNSAATAS